VIQLVFREPTHFSLTQHARLKIEREQQQKVTKTLQGDLTKSDNEKQEEIAKKLKLQQDLLNLRNTINEKTAEIAVKEDGLREQVREGKLCINMFYKFLSILYEIRYLYL
jgi:hypothetical protein